MKYDLNRNLKDYKEDQQANILDSWAEQLQGRLIRFSPTVKINSFKDLINEFFYIRKATYFVNKVNECGMEQCSLLRRRSLIDFYLIQKFYLKYPMTIHKCFEHYKNLDNLMDLYVEDQKQNYIVRGIPISTFTEQQILINAEIYTLYHCSGVKRNVFAAYLPRNRRAQSLKPFAKYRYKIKEI